MRATMSPKIREALKNKTTRKQLQQSIVQSAATKLTPEQLAMNRTWHLMEARALAAEERERALIAERDAALVEIRAAADAVKRARAALAEPPR